MADDDHLLRRAQWLRAGLLIVLALVSAATAVGLLRTLRHSVDVAWRWDHQVAEVASTAWEHEVELEVSEALLTRMPGVRHPEHILPHQEGHTRILLPRPPGAWVDVFDQAEIAFDPARAGHVELADVGSLWVPPLASLLFLGLLGLAAWGVMRLRWGEDLMWSVHGDPLAGGVAAQGGWVSTGQGALRPGSAAPASEELRETRESHKAVVFWNVLLGLIALATVPWALWNAGDDPLGAGFLVLGVLFVWGLTAYTGVETFTRRVGADAAGIRDSSFFRIRRVPWGAITRLERVNLNEEAQRRYDRASKRSGSRPQNLWVWRISDAQGREILHWSEAMNPPAAYAALRERIQQQLVGAGLAAAEVDDHEGDMEDGRILDAAFMEQLEKEAGKSIFDRAHRAVLIGLVAMVLPFAWGAGYAIWRSLWFLLFAASSLGTVVEVRQEGAPSLVVAYAGAPGQPERRIESGGSDFYADIAVGTRLPVYHDPADPENARIALFLEMWIASLLLGGLFLLVLLCALLVGRGLTRPMPMPPALRARMSARRPQRPQSRNGNGE